ncbi:MAG: Hpt domain-containing protein [Acidobacteria bacterium]|nr:Hpt domain-containing protein [Acidobacteriota bacterium]MCB9398291.1 Hpt domain-containing protein [Acidobacteriota bacterium]
MIDRAALSEALGLPPAVAQELIDLFGQFAREQFPILLRACAEENRDLLRESAHALKGSALNINLDPIATTARALEKGASTEPWPELKNATQDLIALIDAEL